MTTSNAKPALPTPRAPTAAELAAIGVATAGQDNRPTRPTLHFTPQGDGSSVISNPHTEATGWWAGIQEAFGTSSPEFVNDAVLKLSTVLGRCDGGADENSMNAALALVAGIAPENEGQAAIAVQIAIAHAASVHMTSKALFNANAGHVEAGASFAGIATKFSRTMVAHVEALAKLRGGGRQIIEHRYITVTAENAIVGDHARTIIGGAPQGVENGNQHQPQGRSNRSREPRPAMPGPQPGWEPLPSPGAEGAEKVQMSRGAEPRRAHGRGKRSLRAWAPD